MPSLTQREQDLLQRYRQFYLDLVESRRLPETDASGVSSRLQRDACQR